MKKLYFFLLLMSACLCAASQSKVDLNLRMLMQNYEQFLNGGSDMILDERVYGLGVYGAASRASADVMPEIGVIVSLNEGYTVEDIIVSPQMSIVSTAGNMAVVSLPIGEVSLLEDNDAIASVSVGALNQPTMYFARNSAKVNDVQLGNDLEHAYNGSGIVVGMMDQGMDPNHINFSNGIDYSQSRVKAVYIYKGTNGKPSTTALTPEAIKNVTTDNRTSSHATHVMGIAAGSFNGAGDFGFNGRAYSNTPMPYYGIATASDIVMTGGSLYDANIIAGVEEVIKYAETNGKPAVVNLSLGNIIGPHDGSSDICKYLAELGKRAVICIAAGNDGNTACAMSMSGGAGGITASLRKNNAVGFDVDTKASKPYTVQFWSNTNEEFTFEFVIYDSASKEVLYSLPVENLNGRSVSVGGQATKYDHDDVFDVAFTDNSYATFWSSVERNNRYCVQMEFVFNRGDISDILLVPAVRISRTTGQIVNGYISDGSFTVPTGTGWSDLYWGSTVCSSNGSISDMATGENVISVGAYTSAKYFTLANGYRYSYSGSTSDGEICGFSSYGTNPVTGEAYPLIAAPGSAIVSSFNNYANDVDKTGNAGGNGRTNYWGPMQGTSMACPFVTGTVALWLEADPSLTVSEVKDILSSTAVPYTGSDSNLKIKWGAGKIDALAGIKEVLRRKSESGGIDGVLADAKGYVITPVGNRSYNVMVEGAGEVSAVLYNMQGVAVARAVAQGNEVTLSVEGVSSGVYVLTVDTPNTARLSQCVYLK